MPPKAKTTEELLNRIEKKLDELSKRMDQFEKNQTLTINHVHHQAPVPPAYSTPCVPSPPWKIT